MLGYRCHIISFSLISVTMSSFFSTAISAFIAIAAASLLNFREQNAPSISADFDDILSLYFALFLCHLISHVLLRHHFRSTALFRAILAYFSINARPYHYRGHFIIIILTPLLSFSYSCTHESTLIRNDIIDAIVD